MIEAIVLTNLILGVGKLEAGLNLSLPKLSTTLTAAFGRLHYMLFRFHY